jgi:hypothetical protein
MVSRRKGTSYKCNVKRLTGLDTSCVGFCLLKKAESYVTEGKVEEGLK